VAFLQSSGINDLLLGTTETLGPIKYLVVRPSALFFGSFNSTHRHLVEVTPHLLFSAAKLPQAPLDLLDGWPALYSMAALCLAQD
jgi:hypothetical protein